MGCPNWHCGCEPENFIPVTPVRRLIVETLNRLCRSLALISTSQSLSPDDAARGQQVTDRLVSVPITNV